MHWCFSQVMQGALGRLHEGHTLATQAPPPWHTVLLGFLSWELRHKISGSLEGEEVGTSREKPTLETVSRCQDQEEALIPEAKCRKIGTQGRELKCRLTEFQDGKD